MFISGDIFEKLLCCRRKVVADEDKPVPFKVQEELVLRHTNNNQTEYITSSQLLERLKGGTTAVVALVREKRLVVAWLGDSQALLVRKRDPVHVVQPHKPESPNERKRIEGVGGCVVNIQGTWRVLGQLAVSRAIGDVDYKPFLTSECDIKSLEISGDEDFLILACDGLWDTLKPSEAVNVVYSYLSHNNGETDGVGRCLVEAARSFGSDDNITAVVVFLRPVATLMEEEATRVAQGQVSPDMDSFVSMHNNSLPPSINSIFSPPLEQSEPTAVVNSSIPQPTSDVIKEIEERLLQDSAADPLSEGLPQGTDSDSDEGVGADVPEEKEVSPEGAAASNPTEAEVFAALAELDSIPEGACEAGDLEEDSSEEEEEGGNWEYFQMKPKTEPQEDDLLFASEPNELFLAQTAHLAPSSVDEPIFPAPPVAITNDNFEPTFANEVDILSVPQASEISPPVAENVDIPPAKVGSPANSSPVAGSPKTVEGFVTSVELNSPEESFNTNVSVNQSLDYFNTGHIEQNSGPFSVYVSSSPEPASIEVAPQQQQSSIEAEVEAPQQESVVSAGSMQEMISTTTSVEIVHAQSTVEVLTPNSPVEVDPTFAPSGDDYAENEMELTPIPDIMTQSMTGDTHPDMFASVDPVEKLADKFEGVNISEPYNTFDSTDENLFKNIPQVNLLDHPTIPEEPSIHVDTQMDKDEKTITPSDLLMDGLIIENEPAQPAPIQPLDQPVSFEPLLPTSAPDLVKDIDHTTKPVEEPPQEISPMDKIQQEFEQIEQAADEVLQTASKEATPLTESAPASVPPLQEPTSPKEVVAMPIAEPEIIPPAKVELEVAVEKPKKETPKAAPRTTTSKGALKTTPRTVAPAAAKVPTPKDKPKEPAKAAPRTSRLLTAPKSKVDDKKPMPAKPTTTSRLSATRTTKTASTSDSITKTTSRISTSRISSATSQPTKASAAGATKKPLSTSTISSRPTKPPVTKTATSTTTRPTTTSATTTRRPMTTRPLSSTTKSTTTKDSTKASIGATKTASTTSSLKRTPARTTSATTTTTKDTKNSTNRILSTRTTTATTRLSSAGTRTTSTTTTARNTASTRTSLGPQKRPVSATKTGLKAKTEPKAPQATKVTAKPSATANGENKITEEEVTCESKNKLAQEDSSPKDSPSSECKQTPHIEEETSPVITEVSAQEVLVNGDH